MTLTTTMGKGALVRALYTNHPETKNELFFRKGDVLTVIEYDYEGQSGWWLCSHRGQRGICPSNYLEVLEDNYSTKTTLPRKGLTYQINTFGNTRIGSTQKDAPDVDFVNPLDTYDFPRSEEPIVQSVNKVEIDKNIGHGDTLSSSSQSSLISQQPTYANDQPLYENNENEPLYENEEVSVVSASAAPEPAAEITQSSYLDLYDIPRNDLPIYGQSISRLRKYGSCGGEELTGSSGQFKLPSSNLRGRSSSSLGLYSNAGVKLRRPPRSQQSHMSNRSSLQSESAESGIGMVSSSNASARSTGHSMQHPMDLYDVPRSTTTLNSVAPTRSSTNNGVVSSRPQSALSVTSSGMGLSIATSDSKDSLDCLYDVPRNSAKAYVNHMETKYEDVMTARRNRHDSSSSTSSFQSQQPKSQLGHSRHNSTSSIFSAYGYTRSSSLTNAPAETAASSNSLVGAMSGIDATELYDVPREVSQPHPPVAPPRPSVTSLQKFSSVSSVTSEQDPTEFYDVPSQFARKVSLDQQDAFLSRGISSSSLSSNGHHFRTPENVHASLQNRNVDVKLLPLGPKAAMSVCEKLKQEVVASISTILSHVKPKWRTKQNLTEIMPDLKFTCTRLCLAIKDVADFASRSLSNAKRLPDDSVAVRLHRLLTPVINGSQIVQRDVDELEAYFWSVDRLSVSGGDVASTAFSNGDALDQLILCSRSLKHDVTELANFLALHSTLLFNDGIMDKRTSHNIIKNGSQAPPVAPVQAETNDAEEDYDYVSLVANNEHVEDETGSYSTDSQKLSSALSSSTSTVSWQLDSRDEQLLEFYSAQISVTAPQLSQAISTFISAIHQNEPPSVFNVHLKYVILLGYKMLFAGDTVHRNIGNLMLKEEVELKSNDLHKSILALYEASKVATTEFPKVAPMQVIVDRVWGTTQAATQLKKCIFNAVCTAV